MAAPVNPNTPRNKVFTRKFYQEQVRKTATRTGFSDGPNSDPHVLRCQLAAGVENKYINPYEPVILAGTHWVTIDENSDHTIDKIIKGYHLLEINDPDTEELILPRSWGIAIDPITDEIAGRVRISGVSWLDTSDIVTLIPGATHLNIIENELVQGYNGRACIIQEIKQPHCLVELSNHRTQLMAVTTDDGLIAEEEGEVYYRVPFSGGWAPTDILIKAWATESDIGPNVNVRLDPIEGRYLAVELC